MKCGIAEGCAVTADCAIAAGDRAESVRCLQEACTSTKPPSAAGVPLYWQDFAPERLVTSTDQCAATDDVCLHGSGALYPMFGLAPSGAQKPLTKELLFAIDGVVGGGSKFDGATCLTRTGTNLSFANSGSFSAMAWVRSTRTKAPWEGVIAGAPSHYLIAIDVNPATQRFLAAVATNQASSLEYHSSTSTGELGSGHWHHVAEVYESATAQMRQYVDGALVQTTTVSGNVTSAVGDLYLGCRKDIALDQFLIGSMDEVVLYARALSAAELSDYVRRSPPPL